MTSQPNIILIHAESMDGRKMGYTGHPAMQNATPNMDRLAAEGVRFTRCVTNSPVCVPTRRTMATGLYCHNTGVWDNGPFRLDADAST